ncbi:hypothetical protein ACFX11_030911 [Malus domestica]
MILLTPGLVLFATLSSRPSLSGLCSKRDMVIQLKQELTMKPLNNPSPSCSRSIRPSRPSAFPRGFEEKD